MVYANSLMESSSRVEGNEDAFLKLGEVEVYDDNLKAIITVKTEDFVKVVTDAMFKISRDYKFFYTYLKYSKVFYIPTYPSAMGINTMGVDDKRNLWMNVHFIYNECKMDKDRVFGILFHELMHNFFKHQDREEKLYPKKFRTKHLHMKSNICQDFEVNSSMIDDGVVPKDFFSKMNGLYNPKYTGMRWEDILKEYGDKEYKDWLERNGQKFSDRTKEALEAIEKALKTLRDVDSTNAEKERAKDILKKKIDELYGKTDRKIVDKADLSGIRRELDKLASSQLGDMGDCPTFLDEVSNDLKTHPKDMSKHDIEIVLSDIRTLKKELIKNASKIADAFRKDEDDVKNDINKAIKSLLNALDVLHEGSTSIKEERKIIRQTKDDLEGIILNDVDKKRKKEKREEEIKKHKEKIAKEREESKKELDKSKKTAEEKREELKRRNPIKKFVDTFKNLQELRKIDRISESTYLVLNSVIGVLDKLVEMNISDINSEDVSGIIDLIPDIKSEMNNDLKNLKKRKILNMSIDEINVFTNDVFEALEKFFKVLIDEDEPSSVKFGAMSLAVEELRKLGKKLKTKRKIIASKEWKDAYKKTRADLIRIYKEKGKEALKDEVERLGGTLKK